MKTRAGSLFAVSRLGTAGLCLMLASGCAAIRQTASSAPSVFYSLDATPWATVARVRPAAPTLVVNAPRAAAGFDSPRIIYLRQPHTFEYFAHSEWIDTPARMLFPLLVAAVENSGAFGAVVQAPSSASGDLRLDTEIVQLQHEFQERPSRVRFTLRGYLVEDASRRVIASREFEAVAPAPSETPYGGVIAANQAVRSVLEQLAAFCAESAENWRPGHSGGSDPRRP